MKKCKWLNKSLVSKVLVSVLLVMTTSLGLGTSPILAADGTAPEVEWEKLLDGSNEDWAEEVRQTPDGGYIIVGNTYSHGGLHVYLVKTDASGNMEWERTLGSSAKEFAYSFGQTTDGGYIIAGYTDTPDNWLDVYLVKADASGNMEWDRVIDNVSQDDIAYSVQQTTDGGYIIAGYTETLDRDYDVYLVKTDASGNIQWEKFIDNVDKKDIAYSVQQTTDGGYIIAGTTETLDRAYDVYLVKTDASGNMEWDSVIDNVNQDDMAYSVQQTTDGGYIFAGTTDNSDNWLDVYLVKTDASGNMEWDIVIGNLGQPDIAYSVQQTTDGGYITAGTIDTPDGWWEVYLLKTDASGNIEWEKVIGELDQQDIAYSVQQTTDGGYIIAGKIDTPVGFWDIYLIKLSFLANTPVGSDVTVNLESGSITFPTVSESGTTTMTTSTENPAEPTPSDFYVIGGEFIDIITTATYSGNITVGISYDETQVGDEESLRLFHWDGSEWEDITTSVDTVNNIVYGEATSLSPFFIGEPAVPSLDLFMHGDAPDLILDPIAPTSTSAKYKDSPGINRTTFREIGTWNTGSMAEAQDLVSLGDFMTWVGLKNSDDQGTYFDIRAEVLKNGVVIASGEVKDIKGVTRNPNKAKQVVLAFGTISDTTFQVGDVFSIRVLAKVADTGGHSSAVGLRLYYDSVSRPSSLNAVFHSE